MDHEILDVAQTFALHGRSSVVQHREYARVGLRLMDELWRIVLEAGTATTGINHWVYLPENRLFTGVELPPQTVAPAGLELLRFELQRALRHVHRGPYSLEIYGHQCADPQAAETTILIGLV